MDIRRLVIYAGLAISSYMLFYTWDQEYGSAAQANSNSQVSDTSVRSNVQNAQTDTPDGVIASEQLEETDVPDVTAPEVAENFATDEPLGQVQVTGSLITVTTDTMKVTIDPKGGQVINVSLLQYLESLESDQPINLLESNDKRTFVAQSGLIGTDAVDAKGGAEYSTSQTEYVLEEGTDSLNVILMTETDKAKVKKVFTFTRGEYLIDVNYKVTNTSDTFWKGRFYAQLKRDASEDPSTSTAMGIQPYLGAALTTSEDRYKKVSFEDLEEDNFKSVETGGWAAMLQHYFVSAWVPSQDQQHTYNGRYSRGHYLFGFYDNEVAIAPGETALLGAGLYVGPKIQSDLAAIAPNLDLVVDYGFLWWLAQPLFALLNFIQTGEETFFGAHVDIGAGVGNWGISIIILTIIIKLMLYKPTAMSYRSMAKMRKFAPKMQQLRERYGDNREKLGQEMMKLYRDEKINPMAGCLPMLLPMPVFMALYWVLLESVELRQAPFMFWIQDLSIKDPFFILPLLMGASMFIQFKLNPPPQDPMQAKVVQFMPVIMTFFFFWFPAGLVLYWLVNNIFSVTQQYVITRKIESGEIQ